MWAHVLDWFHKNRGIYGRTKAPKIVRRDSALTPDQEAEFLRKFTSKEPELFAVGDIVKKTTGDYRIDGEIRAAFTTRGGALRYVVEHQAMGGGSFCHIYAHKNLTFIRKGNEDERNFGRLANS